LASKRFWNLLLSGPTPHPRSINFSAVESFTHAGELFGLKINSNPSLQTISSGAIPCLSCVLGEGILLSCDSDSNGNFIADAFLSTINGTLTPFISTLMSSERISFGTGIE